MDVSVLVAIGLMAVVTIGGNWLWPSRDERLQRDLEAYPNTLVSEGSGRVRVTGRIRCAGELLQAPLSGRPCVGYELVVETGTGQGGSGLYRRLVDVRDARPFMLTDKSGTARVDTSGSFRLAVRTDFKGRTSGHYPGKHRALSLLLESKGFFPVDSLGCWARIRYAEGVLTEDQLVSVGGPSDREIDQTGERSGLRTPPLRLVLRGTEAEPLLVAPVK